MAYTASYAFAATSGLTLKWSLVAAGTLHATLRNQTTGFTEIGTSGLWEWLASTIPDGYRGVVVIHTNTATALADFTAANTYSVLSVNPGEIEKTETIPASVLDLTDGIETGFTPRQVLRGMASVLLGKSTDDGATYRDLGDTKDRVAATVNSSGERTAVTRDLT